VRRLRSLPISTTFMLLIAGLAVLAIGYGLWSQVLTIRGRINTGNLATAFNRAFTDDDGAVNQAPLDANDTGNCPVQAGGGSSCDPAASGSDPKLRHDKDVAQIGIGGEHALGAFEHQGVDGCQRPGALQAADQRRCEQHVADAAGDDDHDAPRRIA